MPVAWTWAQTSCRGWTEGDILIEAYRLPTATLEDSTAMSTQVEKELLKNIPEVRTVFCKTGRPEIANDMMGVDETDIWVMLKPRDQWPAVTSRDEMLAERWPTLLGARARRQLRAHAADRNAGQRAGRRRESRTSPFCSTATTSTILEQKAKAIEQVLRGIPGSADVKTSFQANLSDRADRARIAERWPVTASMRRR